MADDNELRIERLEEGGRGAFVIRNAPGQAPELLAEMTWSWAGGVMVIAHTGVRPALRGRGVAGMLVQAAVSAARQDGFTIDPQCAYVAGVFRKAPDAYADVNASAQRT